MTTRNAGQANRREYPDQWCDMHGMTGCAECNGLADELRDAIATDQRVMLAIMSRKRNQASSAPVSMPRYVDAPSGRWPA